MNDVFHEVAPKPTGMARFFPGMDAPPTLLRLVDHAPTVILIAATLGVLWFTLFPFQLQPMDGRSLADLYRGFRWDLTNHPFAPTFKDIVQNILLFIPVGFGAAGVIHRRRASWLPVLLVATVYAALLTFAVESVQTRLPGRIASLLDLLSNTAGGLIGGVLFKAIGSLLLMRLVPLAFGHRQGRISTPKLIGWGVAWTLMAMIGIFMVRDSRTLDTWNQMYNLGIGNEFQTDRPWQGTVTRVGLLNRAIRLEEADEFLSDAIPELPYPGTLYDLSTSADRYTDTQASSPDLIRHEDARGSTEWLSTETPPGPVLSAISRANAFTLIAWFQSHTSDQGYYPRIVTVSDDGFNRNVTLAQLNDDLVIRIRAESHDLNGAQPELLIPGLFKDLSPRRLVVSYDVNALRVWVDRGDQMHALYFHPAADLFWMLYPRDLWDLSLTNPKPPQWLYVICMYLIVFLPIGVVGMQVTSLISVRWQSWSLVAWIVLPAVLVQLTVLATRPHGRIWADLLAGVLLTYLAILFAGVRQRSWQRERNLKMIRMHQQVNITTVATVAPVVIDEADRIIDAE